jgi:hypothetical protein
MRLRDWVGYCEFCHFQPVVPAKDEIQAIKLAGEVHAKERGKICKGLIVAAFDRNNLPKHKKAS